MLRGLQGSWPFLDQLLTKILEIAFRFPTGCGPLAQKCNMHGMCERINNSAGKARVRRVPRNSGTRPTFLSKAQLRRTRLGLLLRNKKQPMTAGPVSQPPLTRYPCKNRCD